MTSEHPRVLVVDIGGTHIKLLATGHRKPVRLPSGRSLTPATMVKEVLDATREWTYDVLSIGYPGPVGPHGPAAEPSNLGRGWVGFDFERAFHRPVRLINDASMQALGGYTGGRMLFLGLGTGLGAALVVQGHLQPLELAHLPYRKKKTFEDYVGDASRLERGSRRWRRFVIDVVSRLMVAMQAETLLLGGGNARRMRRMLDKLPDRTRIGSNADAFRGGMRLWQPAHERAVRARTSSESASETGGARSRRLTDRKPPSARGGIALVSATAT
ncbi:MAG: ROK family protein [Gemmatimonadales bacterium]